MLTKPLNQCFSTMSRNSVTRVYVGNLGHNGEKREIEMEFEKFGKLHDVWVARNPPGFAFVEFLDHRDAEDAVRELDGKRICGCRAKVELSHGKGRAGGRPLPGARRDDRDRYNDRYDDRFRRSPPRRLVFKRFLGPMFFLLNDFKNIFELIWLPCMISRSHDKVI